MRKTIKAASISLGLYLLSYMILSTQGQYVPAAIGLSWVKSYQWAPKGYVSDSAGMEHNKMIEVFFFPLWALDINVIHTSEKANSGDYPINTAMDDILDEMKIPEADPVVVRQ